MIFALLALLLFASSVSAAATTAAGFNATATAPTNPLPLPPLGWSTWTTFECSINETLVRESIEALAASPLKKAGYTWILVDDCWTSCPASSIDPTNGHCSAPAPRDAKTGRIVVDPVKFPNGFAPLTALAKKHGLKMGIYTSVSARTCAGFTGSLDHEAVDAAAFVEWGFDFIKHDTCGADYSVHDGGLQAAAKRMADGIWDAGKGEVVYYLDSGNPTSPQRVFNPHQRHVTDNEALLKLAVKPSELAWVWIEAQDAQQRAATGGDARGPHMFKSWFDIMDAWGSTLSTLHNQARAPEYQACGRFGNPDMLTAGMGQQSREEYRAQFLLWSVLGAPLIMGNDVRKMDDWTVELLSNPEVLAVDQDPDCIQGSLARSLGASETWIKPLADGSFAVVLLNKDDDKVQEVSVFLDRGTKTWGAGQDFFPACFRNVTVRDLVDHKDLGVSQSTFTASVGPHDARMFKMTPVTTCDGG